MTVNADTANTDLVHIVLVDIDLGDSGDTIVLAACDTEDAAIRLRKRLDKVVGKFSWYHKIHTAAVEARWDAVRAKHGLRRDRASSKIAAEAAALEMRAIGEAALKSAGLDDVIGRRLVIDGGHNMTLRTVVVPRVSA